MHAQLCGDDVLDALAVAGSLGLSNPLPDTARDLQVKLAALGRSGLAFGLAGWAARVTFGMCTMTL